MCVPSIRSLVGGDSLVGSAPTYSAVALRATRFEVPTRGPFPIPAPPLSLSVTSLPVCLLSYHNKKKCQKNIFKLRSSMALCHTRLSYILALETLGPPGPICVYAFKTLPSVSSLLIFPCTLILNHQNKCSIDST